MLVHRSQVFRSRLGGSLGLPRWYSHLLLVSDLSAFLLCGVGECCPYNGLPHRLDRYWYFPTGEAGRFPLGWRRKKLLFSRLFWQILTFDRRGGALFPSTLVFTREDFPPRLVATMKLDTKDCIKFCYNLWYFYGTVWPYQTLKIMTFRVTPLSDFYDDVREDALMPPS